MASRLTKQQWLDFSLKELAMHGHAKLSANSLSTKLGVSRGSFYWHFKDFSDFERNLLKRWAELTTENTIQNLKQLTSAKLRLITLVQRAMEGDMMLERAVRSWAISEPSVANAVIVVDARRIGYIEDILKEMSVEPVDVRPRARMLYWASIGHMMLPKNHETDMSAEDLSRFTNLLMK